MDLCRKVDLSSNELTSVIVTLNYTPTTTTTLPSHSIVKDTVTAVDSVESGLDTIVTTIRTENTIDTQQ